MCYTFVCVIQPWNLRLKEIVWTRLAGIGLKRRRKKKKGKVIPIRGRGGP
jgi:hypothetical protein